MEVKRRSGRSLLERLFGCLGPREPGSESSLGSGYEYVVQDRTVFKVPQARPAPVWTEEMLERRRVYEYVRKKTYQNMNPYRMSPNDFLNNISSVFVENLKEPVPKDPLCRPRIYNSQPRGVERFHLRRRAATLGPPQANFAYREALEDQAPHPPVEEKVLVWKIVVVNNSEDKHK